MLYINFELILMTIGFFMNFKVTQKLGQRPWAIIVQGISSKMAGRKFSIFIIFFDTYTCFYVIYQV